MKLKCLEVVRKLEYILGATPYSGVTAICGDQFFERFITNANVKEAYERWNDGQFFRTGAGTQRQGFPYCDINWMNYRGRLNGSDFIPTASCRFIPTGVPNLFKTYYAPADFIETVNTVGKATYAKQERMKFDKGIDLHTQSNALTMCLRPGLLLKGNDIT